MHKEEFFFTLIEDEFISWLLSQIEKIAKEYKIDEIIELINNLENDCHNDMISIFGNALDEILKDLEEKDSISQIQIKTIKSDSLSISNTNCIYRGINHINNKNNKFDNLDELVAYINTNDKPTKKNKKKNMKKKNTNNNCNKSDTKSNILFNKNIFTEDESVVENFKKNIYMNSKFADSIRKIKPNFSTEWIKTLQNYKEIQN